MNELSFMTPNSAFQGTHQERHVFEIFRTVVASQMSSYFDGWFWHTTVLQASHQEPAIRHAILALSGLVERMQHEDRLDSPKFPGSDEGTFALLHYNHAIRELHSSAQKNQLSLDVCLMTCLLFASFEVGNDL